MALYHPREDSYLLAKHVKERAFGNVLDMGTGSGILAETAAEKHNVKSVLAVDIQKSVVDGGRRKKWGEKIRFAQSDLFSNVKGVFDTIIFNPPYLPENVKLKDITVEGGRKGYETLERFFRKAGDYLAADGIILIVFSSLTRKEKVNEFIKDSLMEHEELEKKRFFFEELYTYLIRKSALRKELESKGLAGIIKFAKGHRGIIFTAVKGRKRIAVKVQRRDTAARGAVEHESVMLKTLNMHGIGSKLLFSGRDFMVYEFVEGDFLPEFAGRAGKSNLKRVLKKVLEQCRAMDVLGVNKEEMHHPHKHIVVTKAGEPVLLDFERARNTERPHNVTQFCQYVTSRKLRQITGEKINIRAEELRKLAASYKKEMSEESFEEIKSVISSS